MWRWVVLIPLMLFGANEVNKSNYFKVLMQSQNPYVFDKKARLELKKAEIEAKTKEKMAEFEYKKAVDVEKVKKEAVEVKSKSEVEKQKVAITPAQKMVEVKKQMVLYGVLVILALLIVGYMVFKRYQAYKERIELEKMRLQEALHEKEMAMKEKELQAQMAGKLIDAIASGKLSKEQEEKLLKIATGGQHLLEDKK